MESYLFEGQNTEHFSDVCGRNFGRKVIKTNKKYIDSSNIVEELGNAMFWHRQNSVEINYLDRTYRGDAPIYYRNKVNRPEVNNKVHVNLAYPLVELKTSEMAGEPIQYVLRGTDKKLSEQIAELNAILAAESKDENDIEVCRWRSICGTAYKFVGNDNKGSGIMDDTDFYIDSCDPRETFVVYYNGNKRPAFSCQISQNEEDKEQCLCFTDGEYFIIVDGEIVDRGINGNGMIPVVEYPNNSRRLSDIEITISIQDAIDTLASDRVNGIEQFVASWIKFVNCEIDKELFKDMRQEGALVVKSNNGAENKADVDIISQELNQTEGQVVMDDLFNKFLIIQGLANRQVNSSDGGSTMGAVQLRSGYYDSEKRAELSEPVFKKAERQFVKLILNRFRVSGRYDLKPSDIEIKISRSKMDNMLVKAEVLQILLNSGIKYERAIKTVGLFSDPEQVSVESKKRMEVLYPEDGENTNKQVKIQEVI